MEDQQQASNTDNKEQPRRRRQPQKRTPLLNKNSSTIYTGPNLRGLAQYTVFRDAVPEAVARMMERQPAIRQLLVPLKQMDTTVARINRTGTMENIAYDQLRKDVK